MHSRKYPSILYSKNENVCLRSFFRFAGDEFDEDMDEQFGEEEEEEALDGVQDDLGGRLDTPIPLGSSFRIYIFIC